MTDGNMRPNPLAERLQITRSQLKGLWLKLWGGGLLVVFIGFAITWIFIEPAPPNRIVIAAGPQDGAYFRVASEYAALLKDFGVTLEVRETAGSIENYELLRSDPEVHLALVQGGTAPVENETRTSLQSLGSLYLEPVWVFYRGDELVSDLRQLQGRKIAIGRDGSGTQAVARRLLDDNGLDAPDAAELFPFGTREAIDKLRAGDLDAAFFVTAPTTPFIIELLESEGIRLMSFDRHEAWSRRHAFLSDVTLDRGVLDLKRDLPAEDVHLLAPAANLVCTPELHHALVPLLLRAAKHNHEAELHLVEDRPFPNRDFIEFELNESARRYYESGPPLLQKYLPFWVASAIDRGKILLLPLLTLLFPLFKVAPPLYRWRIRSRIYRWYRVLREIERELKMNQPAEVLRKHQAMLSEMERELDDLDSVPLAYMEEFYNLRLHVEFVDRRVSRRLVEEANSA